MQSYKHFAKQLSKFTNYILAAAVVAMLALCALSISAPMRQDRRRQQRERVVRERMGAILRAESRYRAGHGVYTGDFAELVRGGLLADTMRYVPYSGKQEFELEATVGIGPAGQPEPMVRVAAEYSQYLDPADADLTERLSAKAADDDRYPGVEMTLPGQPTTTTNKQNPQP